MANPVPPAYRDQVGEVVLIRKSSSSPNAGRVGIICAIDSYDADGPFLVRFDDGLQFRYAPSEIVGYLLRGQTSQNHPATLRKGANVHHLRYWSRIQTVDDSARADY